MTDITTCLNCKSRVIPMTGNICPSCRKKVDIQPAELNVTSTDPNKVPKSVVGFTLRYWTFQSIYVIGLVIILVIALAVVEALFPNSPSWGILVVLPVFLIGSWYARKAAIQKAYYSTGLFRSIKIVISEDLYNLYFIRYYIANKNEDTDGAKELPEDSRK